MAQLADAPEAAARDCHLPVIEGLADCLDRILILGRRHLEHVLRIYRSHYNEHRPHRALDPLPPHGCDPTRLNTTAPLRRRDLLGGLIHEYEAA